MKRILGFFLAAIFLVGCAQTEESQLTPSPEGKKYRVSLKVGAGVEEGPEEPMRTMRTAATDVYGIQVYARRKAVEGGTSYNWSKYAYGLFDQKDSISVEVLDGYEYNFVATMVKDAKNVISNYSQRYNAPFIYGSSQYNSSGQVGSPALLANKFFYHEDTCLKGLGDGWSSVYYTTPSGYQSTQQFHSPFTDRYYGACYSFTPSAQDSSLALPLYRAVFGVKYVVKGLTSGRVLVKMTWASDVYIDTQNLEVQKTVTFENVAGVMGQNVTGSATLNDNYSEYVTITASWLRPDGITVPIGSKNVSFKRKRIKTININVVGGTTGSGGNIAITEEEGELTEDGSEEI